MIGKGNKEWKSVKINLEAYEVIKAFVDDKGYKISAFLEKTALEKIDKQTKKK